MRTLSNEFNDTMAELSLVDDRGTLCLERRFVASVDQVWATVTCPGLRSQWLARGDIELRRGGNLELAFEDIEGLGRVRGARHTFGVVTDCHAPNLLVCWWTEVTTLTNVIIEISHYHSQAQLLLTHGNLALDRVPVSAARWHAHLAILNSLLKRERPSSFGALFEQLFGTYRVSWDAYRHCEHSCS